MRRCALSTRMVSMQCCLKCAPVARKFKENEHGKRRTRKNQAGVIRRYGALLYHQQEQAHHPGKTRIHEVRPGGSQACRLQGNQAEVIRPGFAAQRKTRESGFFVFGSGIFGWSEPQRNRGLSPIEKPWSVPHYSYSLFVKNLEPAWKSV